MTGKSLFISICFQVQATPFGRFLATLSAHLTASSPADLCGYFNISDEKKSSIISSEDPGLSVLLALDEIGIINPSKVEALEQPFSELKLVQAKAKIQEYQSVIEEGNQLQQQTTLTEKGKKELFIKCLQKRISSWCETTTPVPWKKSCRWKSTDLFVGSVLVLTDPKAKKSLIDIDEECKLQYNQILTHSRLRAEKRIVLVGEPGSGKTMMSLQVAYDWSQGKISEIDVLIFLPLTFVNNITLVQAVKRFYFSTYDSISVNDIESFLTNGDLQSCLILDGIEEYNSAEMTPSGEPSEVTKIMEKSKFSNCKVILTSRSEYSKDLPTCPMLRMGRFGEKEQQAYIEKVFANNTEKQEEVKKAIEKSPFILDICRVPLLFVMAVHNIESIVMFQENQLNRVAPFMENMVKKICTLQDSTREGRTIDLEDVNDELQLEKFAYNGLCKGQQILLWQRNVLEANVTNLKQFLDSGILVVEEGIGKGNLRIIQEEKILDESSQNKSKAKKTTIDAPGVDQMNQSAQVGAVAMTSSFDRGHSVGEGPNERVTTINRGPVPYASIGHISSRNRFWKRFALKILNKKKGLQSEGTTNKTGSSVRTHEIVTYENVQAGRDPPTREYTALFSPTSVSFQLNLELRESQIISNSSTAKGFPLEVKFSHKVMQEWFASKWFSSLLWKSLGDNSIHNLSYDVLSQISPVDLHYILRFTSYLCPPSCYLIMDFLSQYHRTVNGVIPEYIMNFICLCFAECKQENVPQMTDLDKAAMKRSLDLVVAKLCREVIIIRSDDSRITQQSKVAMLKYAASVGVLIKEVHLVDTVLEVDKTSSTLTSGAIFDMFNTIEILEMSRWDQHLEQKDYQSIVKLVLCSNSIKKASLNFPSQPPVVETDVLGDLIIYDKTVEWIIGPKLIQMLNMKTFKWEVTVQTTDAHATILNQKAAAEAEVGAQVENYFEAEAPDDLTINVGDIITDITLVHFGWWEGEVNGKRGMFPCNFVKVVILNPSTPAARTRDANGQVDTGLIQTDENTSKKRKLWAKVIACYEPQDDDELSLEVNKQIEVTNQSQRWWWEGIAKGKKGMFPSNFVMLLSSEEETKQHGNETPVEAQVVYDYDAVEPGELTIKVGDIITDISVVDEGWWKGVVNGKEGMFPSNYVTVFKGTSENSSQNKKMLAKVCFSHTPESDSELFLVEDDIVEITSQPDPWWWEGIVKDKKGHFPSYCVDLLQTNEEREKSKLQECRKTVKKRVKYDNDAVKPNELTIKVGDTITDITVVHDGWWEGVVNRKRRMYSSKLVEECKGTSESSTQNKIVLVKVIVNHTPQSDDELFLVEDDIVEITSQLNPLWWEGIVNGYQGRFPSYCVVPVQEDEEWSRQQDYAAPVKAQVVYDYDAVEPDELTIKVGDTITDIYTGVGGWWEGVVNGKKGRFPSSFVEIHTDISETSTQNKRVLANVTCSHSSHSNDELSLTEGDIVDITNRQYPGYWEGILNGKKGRFPSHCVILLQKDEGEESKQSGYETPAAMSVESTITNDGGLLKIDGTDVQLIVPAGAFKEDRSECLIRLSIIPPGSHDEASSSFCSNSSTIVELLPNNLKLKLPVQVTLPHCLQLKKDTQNKVKILMSHHEGDAQPRWEEVFDHRYILDDKKCTIWMKRFCWTKYEIDDEIVEAKRIQIYTAAKPVCVPDYITAIQVGYHLDLPGAGEVLRQNPSLIVDQRMPYLFLREGKHPLKVFLIKTLPNTWTYSTPEDNPQEIPFRSVASSVEYSCPFILQHDTDTTMVPTCIFKASQNENDLKLQIRPKVVTTEKQHSGNHSIAEVHRQENVTIQAEENVTRSRQLEESPQDASFQLPLTIPWEIPDAAVRKKVPLQENQHESDGYTGRNLKALRQPKEACQNVYEAHQQMSPYKEYPVLPRSGPPSSVPTAPVIQQNYYNQNFSISPYGTPFGEGRSLYELPDNVTDNRGEVALGYGLIKELGRKLNPADPLGNNWKELADKLGFTMEDIGVFELAPSPTADVIGCAMKSGKLKSIGQLKTILEQIGRSDASSLLRLPAHKEESENKSRDSVV
ncbi:SH3 domain-containing kinase-binding protein 1 [Holothuria leucospilota]|uniref:SH3 domain-containing kinase-binding protein 1 n=1 Tax=Holothuria leucospilota TaxID=206669 RepID=A0A9Q1BWE2_HOLLE|nr:SH3 domain-containing kinase-binding protein 1 [Holothuria leucospilota]